MPKKEEYEEVFNKLLQTDIRWRKLAIEELIELAVLFKNPEVLVNRLGVKTTESMDDEAQMVGEFFQAFRKWKGPLATIYRRINTLAAEKNKAAKTS